MEQQSNQSEIRYLTPPTVDVKKKKYCRFKKNGIKYIDYKDPEFLEEILERTRKDSSASYHRYFFEVPT
jgi:small subunit ribosomal protein S18